MRFIITRQTQLGIKICSEKEGMLHFVPCPKESQDRVLSECVKVFNMRPLTTRYLADSLTIFWEILPDIDCVIVSDDFTEAEVVFSPTMFNCGKEREEIYNEKDIVRTIHHIVNNYMAVMLCEMLDGKKVFSFDYNPDHLTTEHIGDMLYAFIRQQTRKANK